MKGIDMLLTENERIRQATGYFTEETKLMSGMSVACGHASQAFFGASGTRDGVKPMTADTLCDLASATKLFTALCIYRLAEEGKLDLNQAVTRYAPCFRALNKVTVDQVLGFEVCLTTPERIDAQPNRDAALRTLLDIRPVPFPSTRYYSDMPAIVLGMVLESVTDLRLDEVFRKYILDPLGMTDTCTAVPESKLARCALYDREHRIENGRYILRDGVGYGMPHDPKARILSPDGQHPTGHAGLFSTLNDMTLFCRGVLDGAVVGSNSLKRMAHNRCGRPLPDGGWTQYLGSLCFVRHPNQHFSEVPLYMSDQAISMGGFTGNHVSFDPATKRWAVFLGNRILNRISVLIPEAGKSLSDYGLNPDGTGTVVWPDGEIVQSSVDWVHHKDAHMHAVIGELLQE